ncbi:MAG: hypothetical protein ABIP93_02715 [Gemmatimonadaceae bacterium]
MTEPARGIGFAAAGTLRAQSARSRHRVSTHRSADVDGVWEFVGLSPEAASTPMDLDAAMAACGAAFRPMQQACGIAAALFELGELSLDAPPDLDGRDWWIRCEFAGPDVQPSRSTRSGDWPAVEHTAHLVFDGLATIVDVWLNGRWLGRADDMFVNWDAEVTSLLGPRNVLVLCARALTTRLTPRRPRARWRSHLMASQEWRWLRTTQMGRMPGYGPQVPLVGPWRPVRLEQRSAAEVRSLDVAPTRDGAMSVLSIDALISLDGEPRSAMLVCGGERAAVTLLREQDGWRCTSTLRSAGLAAWWPHTHGEPALHPTALHLDGDGWRVTLDLGPIGFRSLSLESSGGQFAVTVNAVRPFLRGTCWTPNDWLVPEPRGSALDAELRLMRDAGINCIRLSGCFTYGSPALIAACDRHGIMVWQDLMFSVLDYPADDEFGQACEREVAQQMALLQPSACVLMICGSAEVDQQAAMMGVALIAARHPLFHERLAATVRAALPHVPYWASTPGGSALPFRTNEGTAHYFGVGAYERPLDDARGSEVRFTTECLAFAQLPEPESPAALTLHDEGQGRQRWKARVPRDGGADWDFEDTRDFYVGHLFGVAPEQLRREDPERYLALGRAATAIAVERTMQEFRRSASPCQGAFTWLWSDPWAGPGWGHIDSAGRPKSSWYAMRRALRARAIALTNEGMNGMDVHAWNDGPARVDGALHVRLLRDGRDVVRAASQPLTLESGRGTTLSVEEILGRFVDVAHSYRFGAPAHDVVHAVWVLTGSDEGMPPIEARSTFGGETLIDDAVLLVHGDARRTAVTGLVARTVEEREAGDVVIALTAEALAQAVRIGSAAYRAEDSYFSLGPGVERRIVMSLIDPSADRTIVAEALNDPLVQRITVVPPLVAVSC